MIQSGWNCECKHVFFAPGSPWTSFAQQSITQCQRFMIRSKPKQGWIWTATYPSNFMVGNVPLVGSQVVRVRFTDPDCSCAWGAATQSAPKQQRLNKLELNFKPRKNSWRDLTFCQQISWAWGLTNLHRLRPSAKFCKSALHASCYKCHPSELHQKPTVAMYLLLKACEILVWDSTLCSWGCS